MAAGDRAIEIGIIDLGVRFREMSDGAFVHLRTPAVTFHFASNRQPAPACALPGGAAGSLPCDLIRKTKSVLQRG